MTSFSGISGGIAVVGSIFFLLIYPLMAIYRSGKNPKIGAIARLCWIVSIAITGPLTAALYFLFHPSGRASRWLAVGSLVFLSWLGAMAVRSVDQMMASVQQEMTTSLPKIEAGIQASVPQANRQSLIQHVSQLKTEMDSLPWYSVTQKFTLYSLFDFLTSLQQTKGALNSDDVSFWESLYAERDTAGIVDLQMKMKTRLVMGQ